MTYEFNGHCAHHNFDVHYRFFFYRRKFLFVPKGIELLEIGSHSLTQ